MNKKLLQQLAFAKDAGTKAMAKDFFHPTPGAGGPPNDQQPGEQPPADGGDMQTSAQGPGADDAGTAGGDGQAISPQELEELLQLLQAQGGAAPQE